jgi:hypothetical protein
VQTSRGHGGVVRWPYMQQTLWGHASSVERTSCQTDTSATQVPHTS